jgi:ATP-dependent exoDNAse (exonuclease V) beta subunit
LPEVLEPVVEIVAAKKSTALAETENPLLPGLSAKDVQQAIARAGNFPRRTTPHSLAIHPRDEAEPEAQADREEEPAARTPDGPGILYGTWWHEFVQTIPWQEPLPVWLRKFGEARTRCPQPERAAREWELFCNSELARWLAEPGRIIQVEMPFLWQESPQGCIEGVMDLAVYSESDGTWNVIDWKTNRVGETGGQGLVEIYRRQIEAYVRVLREMLAAEVRGSLYLTQTGEWLDGAG